MERITLTELLSAVKGQTNREEFGEEDFSEVCIDSRSLQPGCLFFAIQGENFDGHDFAGQALAQGAAGVVCHRPLDCSRTILVEDTRRALAMLAAHYRSRFDIPVVGLTGSVGKTTTKEMIHRVLSARYHTMKTEGNLNNDIGLPRMVFRLEDDVQAAVLEMGMSGFGEIALLSDIARPTLGVITNIGVSHMENLGSQENILKAKLELLSGMEEDAPLLLNGDDPLLSKAPLQRENLHYFGTDPNRCDFLIRNIRPLGGETAFELCHDGGCQTVCLPAAGRHNVLNAAAAFAVGSLLGISDEEAAVALSGYEPCGMRQRIVKRQGVLVMEDCYNASPDSLRAALDTLRDLEGNVKVAVLGDMLELGESSADFHREVGAYAADRADILLTCGEMAAHYIEGFRSAGKQNCLHFQDKELLVKKLHEILEQGDVLLVKASRGMKFEEIISSLYERWSG